MYRNVANVVRATYGETPPPIILVGHSIGGAIAIHTASSTLLPVVGLVAIDVVGGSAIDVLHRMQNFLKGRPKSFKSMDHAIEWRNVANVVRATYGETPPPIILVGHSIGGAIAIHTASSTLLPVVGLVAIDVVGGSAIDVLHRMQNFLKGRPKSFKSMDHAIEWSVKSGQIRNLKSAKVSIVGQVRRCEGEEEDPLQGDMVAEGQEELYDLNYVPDKAERATSEVSIAWTET
ncbi:hypothetical protein AAFF_G00349600 [Aldrovandia affinis]|uniref:protein phosphatase methylesterase-1 n=1 Tax=Aldrovandia affinis TaxID=143900 RepID=A0AAD7WPJ3_9TELE|nr:hypothetical protein AAFF_G00349600 [Aldrovandia affinis]